MSLAGVTPLDDGPAGAGTSGPTALRAPGPPADELVQLLQALKSAPLRQMEKLHQAFGEIVRVDSPLCPIHFVFSPEMVRRVCVERADNYDKSTSMLRARSYLGDGLVTGIGARWARDRKVAQPAFSKTALDHFLHGMKDLLDGFIDRWDRASGEPIDLHDEMLALTLAIIGRSLLGCDFLDERGQSIYRSCDTILRNAPSADLEIWAKRRSADLGHSPLASTGAHRKHERFDEARRALDDAIGDAIAERRQTNHGGDFLNRLLATTHEDGSCYTDRELADHIRTMLLAGHETTASALTFALYELAQNPTVLARVRDEATRVLGDGIVTRDRLSQLVHADMTVREVLRLYPSIYALERRALGEDRLAGYAIPKGSMVVISPWIMHRDPRFWTNPSAFDPRRFSAGEPMSKFAYLPFSLGLRSCIGAAMAMDELKLTVAAVSRRLTPVFLSDAPIAIETLLTLRPQGPVPVTFAQV